MIIQYEYGRNMLKFILVIHGLILIFADGSGKAGLTFEATNNALALQRINATNTHAGGWEKSELRGRLNTGDLWSLCLANSSPR